MSVMYKNGSSWSSLMLQAYPVGAVYISYVSTSPSSLFGGTWAPITGRFPYFNAGTDTGGSNSVTLTVNQMPSHRHTLSNWHSVSQQPGYLTARCISDSLDDSYPTKNQSMTQGGGQPFNNMPAYQTFYAWRRTV